MIGVLLSILSGICMSLQGVFNTRLGEKIGIWETSTVVQGSAFIISLLIFFVKGNGNLLEVKNVNKLYLSGGLLGVIITYTVMRGIKALGPTYSISLILIAQLAAAATIDALGLFGSEQLNFTLNKYLGIFIMIAGIIIFKWKG